MSFSNSDQFSSTYNSYGDLNDEQLLTEDQKNNYLDQINNLTNQNTILKAQFEQAISTTNQLEDVIKKNSELSIELRSVKAEKEQIQHRLEICLKANEENSTIFAKEKESLQQQLLQMASDKEIEVANANKFCAGKLNTMEIQINQLQSSKLQLEADNKQLEAKIEKLNNDAAKYFQLTFDSIDSLIGFFEQLNNTAIEKTSQINQENYPQAMDKEHSKCKKQIATLQKHCQKFVAKINKLQNKMNSNEKKYIYEIDCCNEQINQLKKEIVDSQDKHETTINQLENSNQSLKAELEKLKKASSQQASSTLSEIIVQPPKRTPSQQLDDNSSILNSYTCKKQITELTEANERLEQENQDLKAASKDSEQKITELSNKVKILEKEQSGLLFTIEKLEKEKSTSEIVHNKALEDLNHTCEMLKSKENEELEKNNKLKKRIENLKSNASQNEFTIQTQMKQIENYQTEVQQLNKEKDDLSRNLQTIIKENNEFSKQINSLKDENKDLLDQLQSKPEIRVEDILPSSALRYKGFDAILSDKMEMIINSDFSPAIKINKIYSIIANHYDEVIKIKEDKANHMEMHLQNVKCQLDKLFVDLSKYLSIGVLSFDSILNGHGFDTLISSVSSCVNGYNELKQMNNELNLIVGRVIDEFGQCSDMPSYITSIRQNYEAQTNTLKKQIRKNKELKKAQKVSELKFQSEKKMLENEVSKLNALVAKLKASNSKLKSQVEQSIDTVNSLKAKKENQSNTEEIEESIRGENEQILQKLSESFSNEKAQMQSQIEQIQSENSQLKAIISDQDSSINKLKEQIQKINCSIKEKEDANSQLKNGHNEELVELKKTCDSEKRQLEETYETALSAIQKQIDAQRQDTESMLNDLKDAKAKLKQIQTKNSKLKKEKQKLEGMLKSNQEKEKLEKERQELLSKNELAAVEAKYSKILEEEKAKNEQEKMKIYSFAANELQAYNVPLANIDERGYHSLISNVRKQLDRLSSSDAMVRQITKSVNQD